MYSPRYFRGYTITITTDTAMAQAVECSAHRSWRALPQPELLHLLRTGVGHSTKSAVCRMKNWTDCAQEADRDDRPSELDDAGSADGISWDVASMYWIDAKQRMYGLAARRKMISELGEREKLHQCIRPLEWS